MVRYAMDAITGGTSVSYKACSEAIKIEGFGFDDIYQCPITGRYCEDPFYEEPEKQKECKVLKKNLASKVESD